MQNCILKHVSIIIILLYYILFSLTIDAPRVIAIIYRQALEFYADY